jgi:hypothetical protein
MVVRVSRFAVNLLAMLCARPQLIETEHVLARKGKGKGRKSRPDLWHPNWVGRHYRVKTSGTGSPGHHASPRGHWRIGHYHTVRYGKSWGKRRLAWFEPVFVGKEDDQSK